MAYIKTTWKDRLVERPNTFEVQENPDGTITLIPTHGTVTQAGTPVNAANLNKIEDGIVTLENNVTTHLADITPKTATISESRIDTTRWRIEKQGKVVTVSGLLFATEPISGNTDIYLGTVNESFRPKINMACMVYQPNVGHIRLQIRDNGRIEIYIYSPETLATNHEVAVNMSYITA